MKNRTFPFARCIALLLICSLLMGMSGRNGELIRGQIFRDGQPADSVTVHENEKVELTLDPGADSYRWEMSRNGVDWENIPHADTRILPVTTEMTAQGPLLIRARISVDAEETVTPTVKVCAAPVTAEQERAPEAADAEEAAPEGENAGIPEEAIPEEENNSDAQKAETDALTEDNTPAEAEAPTEGEAAPTEEAEAPTEGEEAPTEEAEAPTEGEAAPTEEAEAPTEGEELPTEEAEAPTEGEAAPTEEAEAPTEGEEAPTEEAEAPTEGEDPPAEETETPTEGEEVPAEEETPAEEGEAPAEEETPAEGGEVPAEEAEVPTEGEEEPVEEGETGPAAEPEDLSEKNIPLEEVILLTPEEDDGTEKKSEIPEESEEPETPEEPEAPENGDTPGMGSFLADLLGGDPAPEEPAPARPRLKLFGAGGGGGGSSNTVYASSYYEATFNSTNGNLGTRCVYFENGTGDPYLVLYLKNYDTAMGKMQSVSINGVTVWSKSDGDPSYYSGSITVNVVPTGESHSFSGGYYVYLKLNRDIATEELIMSVTSSNAPWSVNPTTIEVILNYSGTKEVSIDGGITYSDSATVEPGMQPIYRLTVSNDTDSTMAVTDAYLKDVMPTGVFDDSTIEYSANGSSWTSATLDSDHSFVLNDSISLNAGERLTYYVRATVKANPDPGDYVNTLLFGGENLVVEQALATVTVLKTRADYTVEYYKGAVSTANYLGSATLNGKIGDPITVSSGTDEGQLDWKKPAAGYGTGVLQDTSVTVAEDGSSVVRVLYPELEATINYVAVGNGSVTSPSETIPCVTGTASGSTAVPDTGKRFIGWYSDSACTVLLTDTETFTPGKGTDGLYHDATYYAKFEADLSTLTITKSGMASGEKAVFTVSDGAGTTFRIAVPGNGGSVTVTGVTVGKTYTVTEDTGWSWRYTATSASQSVTIPTTGGTVEFSNSQSNIYGLDDSTSRENKYNNG